MELKEQQELIEIANTVRKYEDLAVECNRKQNELDSLKKDRQNLWREIQSYIFYNKLYVDIEELKNFNNILLERITLVDDNGRFHQCGEGSSIKNGRYDYSSFEGGLEMYDENTGLYHTHYWGTKGSGTNYIGFLDIKFDVEMAELTKETLELEQRSKVTSSLNKIKSMQEYLAPQFGDNWIPMFETV